MAYTLTKRNNDIILTPKSGKHERTIIWLHGLGDSAEGFEDVFNTKYSFVDAKTKVVLLTAPQRKMTINGGSKMNSWFDIRSRDKTLSDNERLSVEDINDSFGIVKANLDQEIKELNNDSSKVFVGGFSQGCGLSLFTAVNYEKALGGIIGLSGNFFSFIKIDNLDENKLNIPIFIYHGKADNMVDFQYASAGHQRLSKVFKNIQLNSEDNLGHSLSDEELLKIKAWYQQFVK